MDTTESSGADVSFVFDTDVSSYTVGSIKSIYETSWFNLLLHGLRNSFNRVIQSSSVIEFTFSDRIKELYTQKTKSRLAYPYAYIIINDVELVKDQINTGAMARRGIYKEKLQGNAVPMSYLFPFKMNLSLNVLDSDVQSLFALSQAIFLADASRGLNFAIRAHGALSKIKVLRTGNISFSESTINTDTENDYGTGHIMVSFEVQGWMGFTSLLPTVKHININVLTEEVGIDPILHARYSIDLEEGADGKVQIHSNKL